MTTTLHTLADHGQSPWLDYLSRAFVSDGDLGRLAEQGIAGVTSNPTIFQGAIADGDAYDDQIRELSETEQDPKEVFLALAAQDIRDACDVLRPVFDRGEATRDGWVSLEVDPTLAHDAEGTVAEAKRIAAMIERPNLFVKIPGTREGLTAIEETIAAGIPVNVTLLFSLQRHREAAHAYLAGLRRLRDSRRGPVGGCLGGVVLRVPGGYRGRSPAGRARRSRRAQGQTGRGQRPARLSELSGDLQRSRVGGAVRGRGVGPAMPVGVDIGQEPRLRRPALRRVAHRAGNRQHDAQGDGQALIDHGTVADTLTDDLDGARAVFDDLAQAGIDYDDVVAVLEREGVEKFADSFSDLIDGVADKHRQFAAA